MKKSTLRAIIGFVLIVVLLAAAWVAGWQITGNMNPLDWTKPKEENESSLFVGSEQDSLYSSDGKMMRFEKSAGVRSVNESGDEVASYTLSIIVTPVESEITSFAWSADFENTQSAWASGKNVSDYVTITPAANNRSAEVTCLQAFGEPINVKCEYTENTTLFATCKFDYVKRVIGGGETSFDCVDFNDGEVGVNVESIYGVGTVVGKQSNWSAWGELSDEAYNYIVANEYYSRWRSSGGGELKKIGRVCEYDPESDWFSQFASDFFVSVGGNGNYCEAAFKLLSQNTTNQLRIGYRFTYSYGDSYSETVTIYSDYISLLPGNFETNLLTVSGLQMEQTNGVF